MTKDEQQTMMQAHQHQNGASQQHAENGHVQKNQSRKMKKKRAKERKRREAAEGRTMKQEPNDSDGADLADVRIEYVAEGPAVEMQTDPVFRHFLKVFKHFQQAASEPESGEGASTDRDGAITSDSDRKPDIAASVSALKARAAQNLAEAAETDAKNDDAVKGGKGANAEAAKLSKKKWKRENRPSIASLKRIAPRPDLVEYHDVSAREAHVLVQLKAVRNSVPVPRHWSAKSRYLQRKRGIDKPPFELPAFIRATGIQEMRAALAEKEDKKTLKQRMRERVRPKTGKIDIDYQKLHDAFFRYQTKPSLSAHGELYYEGKEFETRMKDKKPGELSDALRIALGMPIGPTKYKFPPPWLVAMQRYGPPPTYPHLKIPGLNAPIPEGCQFGYHAGGWGKPPVDEQGRPLYGDVFGVGIQTAAHLDEFEVERVRWGEFEEEEESESEESSESDRELEDAEPDDDEAAKHPGDTSGLATPAEGLATPSGFASTSGFASMTTSAGLETPESIQLRKSERERRVELETEMDAGDAVAKPLFQVVAERTASARNAALLGTSHVYDVPKAPPPAPSGAPKPRAAPKAGGIEVALAPEELESSLDSDALQAKYEYEMRAQKAAQGGAQEDLSDMVAEHAARQAKKRRKEVEAKQAHTAAGAQKPPAQKDAKKYKDFKF